MISPELFLKVVKDQPETENTVALATIASVNGTSATVTFDGESSASTKEYMSIGYTPVIGDRVALLRAGHSWVILGKIGSASGSSHSHTGVFESPALTVEGDWDSYVESGFYKGNGLANSSPGHGLPWRRVLVIQHTLNYVTQVSFSYSADGSKGATVYHRARDNGTWRAWMPLDVGQDTEWHYVGGPGEPAFENGWQNYGAGWSPARFRKDAGGYVHLEAMVNHVTGTGLSSPATFFPLPAGYRPSHHRMMPVIYGNSGTVRGDVLSSGVVRSYLPSGYTTGWLYLSAVFLAEQ